MTTTDYSLIVFGIVFIWGLISFFVSAALDPYRVPPRAAMPFLLSIACFLIIMDQIEKGGRWLFGYRS